MSKITVNFKLANVFKNRMKNFKIINLILLILLTGACIHSESDFPTGSEPLTKWTTKQLVTKGKSEFTNKNFSESIKYLQEAAKRDDKEALYALGYIQYHGLSVANNPKVAQDLIRRSAELGYEPALKALRLFLGTRSQFTVVNDTPTYLDEIEKKAYDKTVDKTDLVTITDNTTNKIVKATPPTPSITTNKNTTVTISNDTKNKNTKTTSPIPTNKSTEVTKDINQTKVVKLNNSQFKPTLINSEADNQKPNKVLTQPVKNINIDWLNKQDSNDYTIQVLAEETIETIETFISQNNLKNKLHPFSYYHKNKLWYGAGFGVFKKSEDAYSAMLNDLPPAVASKKPWVRQFKNINNKTT